MNARTLSRIVVIVFVLLGSICVSLRRDSRNAATEAIETSLWRLTYDVSFQADEADAEVKIAFPSDTSDAKIVKEEITYPDLTADPKNYESSEYREVLVKATQPGRYRVTAGFEIRLHPNGEEWGLGRLTDLAPNTRSRYLRAEDHLPIYNSGLQRVLQKGVGNWETQQEHVQWIFDYCAHQLPQTDGQSSTSNVANLVDENPSSASPLGRARLMVSLCRAARIPARLVTGFELRQQETIEPHVWVEVFGSSRWMPFDPVNGYAWHMPINFIPARRGSDRRAGEAIAFETRTSQVSQLSSEFTLLRLPPSDDILRSDLPHPIQILDLTRLPVEMHQVMSLLLLVPLGALITALFRNVIGIRTFGTFAPALLAMSFLYADWTTGLVILTIVVVAGLTGRAFLERLHLLMVPRLSIILTVIILCVLFSVSALDYLSLTPSAEAVLLPLVILTIMIERFFVSTEEDGLGFSLQLIVGTLVVAAFCYVLLMRQEVGELIFIYPEIHFFTIAAFIVIGRYTGYRITELWRFRDLVAMEKEGAAAALGQSMSPPSSGAITSQDDPLKDQP